MNQMIKTTLTVLDEIGITGRPMITAYNKADLTGRSKVVSKRYSDDGVHVASEVRYGSGRLGGQIPRLSYWISWCPPKYSNRNEFSVFLPPKYINRTKFSRFLPPIYVNRRQISRFSPPIYVNRTEILVFSPPIYVNRDQIPCFSPPKYVNRS